MNRFIRIVNICNVMITGNLLYKVANSIPMTDLEVAALILCGIASLLYITETVLLDKD